MPMEYTYEHVVTPRDTVSSGFAYDASYLEWACTTRERMFIDHMDVSEMTPPWFLVGETNIRYMQPACLNDRVEIRLRVADHNVDKGYARFDYRFVNKASGQLLAHGHQVIFFYDGKTGKRASIPQEFTKLL
jgi:acyl-CoA thioesterase FadM